MQFADIFLVATLLVTPSFALVMRDTLPSGYQQTELQWSGVIEEGGPVLRFNGTIEVSNKCLLLPNKKLTTSPVRRATDQSHQSRMGYAQRYQRYYN